MFFTREPNVLIGLVVFLIASTSISSSSSNSLTTTFYEAFFLSFYDLAIFEGAGYVGIMYCTTLFSLGETASSIELEFSYFVKTHFSASLSNSISSFGLPI